MSTIKAANLQNTGSGAPIVKNSSGTEIGQFSKAWANLKCTGTVSIRDSFNVSSLTDNGTGDFTVTFTNAFANTNFTTVFGGANTFNGDGSWNCIRCGQNQTYPGQGVTTSTVRMFVLRDNGNTQDMTYVGIVVFGG